MSDTAPLEAGGFGPSDADRSGVDLDTLRHLSRRSDAHGLAQLAVHALMIGAASWLIHLSRGGWWLAPALVLQGIALDFLFCALHESVHRTAFASRWLNDAVAWVSGALLVLPPEFFRAFHFAHHRHAQDPARDPELSRPPPSTLGSYLWLISGIPNWTRRISTTLRHATSGRVREPFVASGKHGVIVREARLLWAAYGAVLAISLAARSDVALVYWIVPAVLGQPFLRMYLLAEHTGCASGSDTYANTRTTYTNGLVRALAWQMPFHVEHHAFPAIPFHALRRVNALIRPRIAVSAPGYWAVQRTLIRRMRAARAAASPEQL